MHEKQIWKSAFCNSRSIQFLPRVVENHILNLDKYIYRAIYRALMNDISLLDSWTDLHGYNTWT